MGSDVRQVVVSRIAAKRQTSGERRTSGVICIPQIRPVGAFAGGTLRGRSTGRPQLSVSYVIFLTRYRPLTEIAPTRADPAELTIAAGQTLAFRAATQCGGSAWSASAFAVGAPRTWQAGWPTCRRTYAPLMMLTP
jgi:hypothetical protein